MNVLQVNTVYPNGSTGRIAAEIAAYTAAQPDAQAFAAFGIGERSKQHGLTSLRIGGPLGRKYHGALRKLFDAEGYASRFATGQLIRFCEANHVDVVHMHNLHGCYINLKRWFHYLKASGIPVVWTLHDSWAMTGHCASFTYSGCERWKTLCRRCPQKREYPACIGIGGSRRNHRLKRKLFTGLGNMTIVAPCRWMQGIVGESYLQGVPCRVIYNGVDTERFRPVASELREQFGLMDNYVLLAAASVWTDFKGLNELVKLSAILDAKYKIVILGLTREQIAALPDAILGLGHTASQEELAAWYAAADCFINPTLEDTMPLVNLEALACGTPIAVYNTGGCPEAVADGCGAVVDKGDVNGLADAVRKICETGADHTDACITQAKRFTKETMVQAYYQLYQEVIG